MTRPIVHLFCNAHIDPVWMWGWEEGLRETISTFRTACDLLDEFPEFVFNQNESLLYAWVEEYDPPLFARIRAAVQAGRWNITGGWYLQPDVNLLGGETLVRVILEGRRYFAATFGARPPVAYNFDSFGHPCSLPQLLKQSGFEMYIHCRPVESQLALPGPFYRWRGPDGSEVLAVRPDTGWYGTPQPGQAQQQALNGVKIARETGRDTLVTWGLGDHGGGATRQDLLAFRALIAEYADSDVEIRHSTPEAFLERIQPYIDDLPVYTGELQRTLSGTYTSVAPIKRQMREGEMLLANAERWAALAWWRCGRPYPHAQLHEAWQRLMFNTFHDVLCGSLVESALAGVEDMFGCAHDAARRVIVKAQSALLPNVTPTLNTIPLYVFNPHSVALRAPVGINFLSAYTPPPAKQPYTLYDDVGQVVPSQDSGGASVILDASTWQPFVGFVADVPPLSVRRYEVRFVQPLSAPSPFTVDETEAELMVRTPFWQAVFDRVDGALTSLIDCANGQNVLTGPLRLMAMRDHAHAWGGENNWVFNEPVAAFKALSPLEVGEFVGMEGHTGPAVRVTAHGAVWLTVETLTGWQHTRASIKHTFYADLPYIDLHVRLYMQARRKMIKLQLPLALPEVQVINEVPHGAAARTADATEWPYARWLRLESPTLTVGVANNGQNGYDVSPDGVLNLSITRGGTHCSWSETDVDPTQSYTFMDQGQIDTRFRLLAGCNRETITAELIPAALELNQPLDGFFAYHTPAVSTDNPEKPAPFLQVSPPTVALSALKVAEKGDALIVRLHETIGQMTEATLTLEGLPPLSVSFSPYQLRTFQVTRAGRWTACNLLEESDDSALVD